MPTKGVKQNEGRDAARPQPPRTKFSSTLLRKFTKLKPLSQPKTTSPPIASPPSSPTFQLPAQRPGVPVAPTDHASAQRRKAALQRCGLVPVIPKDLSQLEQELDEKFSHVVTVQQDQPEQGELSTAEKIRREWQANNETRPAKEGGDLHPKEPIDVASDSLSPSHIGKSDLTKNAEDQKTLEVPIPTPQTEPSPSLYSIPVALFFPDIPEEDVAALDSEKPFPSAPFTETVDPLNIPLPVSPSPPSAELPEIPPIPSPGENKRPPPIVIDITTNDAKKSTEDATRGRSPNRESVHSLTTKSSLPTLSPTRTASSLSSIPTPRDDESRERMDAMIPRSTSGKSRSSRLMKASDTGRDLEDLDVVHETIPESPEPTATEPRTWNPNRESTDTMDSTGFEAFVEKREKRRMPPSAFKSNKRSLPSNQTATEQPQSKLTRSKSVIASLGLRMTRKMALHPASPSLPPSPSLPVRRPTIMIVHDRERLMQEAEGIEDHESRRLAELAFMDF